MNIWLAIIGMALVTYVSRVTMLLALRGEVVPWLRRWLSYVPVAVFTALILPPLLIQSTNGSAALVISAALPAGLVGALVSWRTGNVLLTIVAGLMTFWVLRFFGIQ